LSLFAIIVALKVDRCSVEISTSRKKIKKDISIKFLLFSTSFYLM